MDLRERGKTGPWADWCVCVIDTCDVLRLLAQRYPAWRGKNRLVEFALRHVSGKRISTDRFGSLFLLDLDNYVDSFVFVKGGFETEEMNIFAKHAADLNCRTFLDVGANFGLFTVSMARQPWCSGVYAFEPDPRNYAQLMANLFLNNLCEKVVAYPLALSVEDGTGRLHLARARHSWDFGKFNSGTSVLVSDKDPGTGEQTVMVETRKLDSLLDLHGEAVAIKIDTEGHELKVLKGMRRLLEQNRCILLIEVFPECRDAVFSYLGGKGYRAASEELETPNFLFMRRV